MSNDIVQLARKLFNVNQIDYMLLAEFVDKISNLEREECIRVARIHKMEDGTIEEQKAFRYAQRCIVNSINSRNF